MRESADDVIHLVNIDVPTVYPVFSGRGQVALVRQENSRTFTDTKLIGLFNIASLRTSAWCDIFC